MFHVWGFGCIWTSRKDIPSSSLLFLDCNGGICCADGPHTYTHFTGQCHSAVYLKCFSFPLFILSILFHHSFSVDICQQQALVLPDRRVSALPFVSLCLSIIPLSLLLYFFQNPHLLTILHSPILPYSIRLCAASPSLSFSYSCSPWNASLNRFSWNVLFTFFHPLFHLYRQWPFQLFL